MREDYCFRTNESRDWVNVPFQGITDDQKTILIGLRVASRSHLEDCRSRLEKHNWDAKLAYHDLNREGLTNQLSV